MSENTQKTAKQGLPSLAKSTIWMLSFRLSRRSDGLYPAKLTNEPNFSNFRRRPAQFGLVFILPPLAGMLVQPIVGYYSDRTWMPRLGGRRLPICFMAH